MSPYYTTLDCAQTHYLVCTDPTLHGPLTDSGCTYASYFTSVVTPEVKAEQSSEMGAEQSSDLKSRVEQSSDLEVGWNVEQQKCEMGRPLTGVNTHILICTVYFPTLPLKAMHFSASIVEH